MASVSESWARYSSRSHSLTSTLLPTEQTLLMPVVPWVIRSMRKPPESRPLWTMRDTLPGVSPSSQMVGVTKENT